MATVRKRTWGSGGVEKTAWIADYTDQGGKRHLKTFRTKRAADTWLVSARGEVARGTHTPDSSAVTVGEAGGLWIQRAESHGLERGTVEKYRSHLSRHIEPRIGTVRLARLTTPEVERFRDGLARDLSWPMARKVLASLKALLAEAQRRGMVAQNVAAPVRMAARKRERARLGIGHGIPTKADVQIILTAVDGRWRPLLVTAAFSGLRSSELRGLTWRNVDLEAGVLHVRQRVDQWGRVGPPKSAAGNRSIPMSPLVAQTLREWRESCPEGELGLVFPNGSGRPESHSNLINRGLNPALKRAGVAHYGMHGLRHFFASLLIEQGFGPKRVQALMGHSSIQQTFDRYGHLFPSVEDDLAKLTAAEKSVTG